jgi:hypothetical protein
MLLSRSNGQTSTSRAATWMLPLPQPNLWPCAHSMLHGAAADHAVATCPGSCCQQLHGSYITRSTAAPNSRPSHHPLVHPCMHARGGSQCLHVDYIILEQLSEQRSHFLRGPSRMKSTAFLARTEAPPTNPCGCICDEALRQWQGSILYLCSADKAAQDHRPSAATVVHALRCGPHPISTPDPMRSQRRRQHQLSGIVQ